LIMSAKVYLFSGFSKKIKIVPDKTLRI